LTENKNFLPFYSEIYKDLHEPKMIFGFIGTLSKVDIKALVILLMEHFNSKLRSMYEMSTVQQFYQFSAAVEETLTRISNCGFSYFTLRDSYYDVPKGMFSFEDIPKVPCPVARKGSKEDVVKIRHQATTYGDSTRQLSIGAKSTKDNPGTLLISAYGQRTLLNNAAPLEDLTGRIQEESKTDEADEENAVGREERVERKDEVVLMTKFVNHETKKIIKHCTKKSVKYFY